MILLQGCNQSGFETEIKKDMYEDYEESVFIAESPIMKRLYKQIKILANMDSPILLLGDIGTGHSRTAYEIFYNNEKASQTEFVKLACYDFDQKYIKEQLFGNQGLLYKGSNTTLFIKGIECFGPSLQKRFLSFLLNPVNKKTLPRLICSSTESLSEDVKEDRFSSNLFEILSQQILILPSLSERAEDIPLLISHFNDKNAFSASFDEKALQRLISHSWKGNIKELNNICFQASILHNGKEVITEADINMMIDEASLLKNIYYEPKLTLEKLMNHYIQMSLEHFQCKKQSAQALGISVKTIYNKIQKGHIVFSESAALDK